MGIVLLPGTFDQYFNGCFWPDTGHTFEERLVFPTLSLYFPARTKYTWTWAHHPVIFPHTPSCHTSFHRRLETSSLKTASELFCKRSSLCMRAQLLPTAMPAPAGVRVHHQMSSRAARRWFLHCPARDASGAVHHRSPAFSGSRPTTT